MKSSRRAATFILLFAWICLIGAGCTVSALKIEFERGEKASQERKFDAAIGHYEKVLNRAERSPLGLKAAAEAARIAYYEVKRFQDAVRFYKHLVLYSPEPVERQGAQRKIAELYFQHILDYSQAIVEYQRLLELPHSPDEAFQYRMAVAKSYFYTNNFFQALVEIETLLKAKNNTEQSFDAFLLKANVYLAKKDLEEAVKVLTALIQTHPDRSRKESVALILAVCYEEQKNYVKAIETLDAIKETYPRRDFIESKIKFLKERQSYLPGARGLRK